MNSGEPEFEDEPPGAYLSELGVGRASVAWGLVNLAGTAALAAIARAANLGSASEWFAAARLTWCLLPVSALLLLIITAWKLGTAYTTKPPGRVLLSLACAGASLGLWVYFAIGLGILAPEAVPD